MKIDIKSLREKTQNAIQEGQEKHRADEAVKDATQRAEKLKKDAVIKSVLEMIPSLCNAAAAEGKQEAAILVSAPFCGDITSRATYLKGLVSYPGIETMYGNSGPNAGWTLSTYINVGTKCCYDSVIAEIMKACKEAGLTPFFSYDYDGGGEYSWSMLCVSWK